MSEGCVRTESLLWEEGLGKTRIRTTEGLTACMVLTWHGAAQRVDRSSTWNFLRKQWLDRVQELITVIQEETKRTEEKEEGGYRSPRGQHYEHCKRSTKPRDLKARL